MRLIATVSTTRDEAWGGGPRRPFPSCGPETLLTVESWSATICERQFRRRHWPFECVPLSPARPVLGLAGPAGSVSNLLAWRGLSQSLFLKLACLEPGLRTGQALPFAGSHLCGRRLSGPLPARLGPFARVYVCGDHLSEQFRILPVPCVVHSWGRPRAQLGKARTQRAEGSAYRG